MLFGFYELLMYGLYFGLPFVSLLWFGISLYRYKIAGYRMKHGKQQYSDQDMKRRKLWLIVSAVVFGVIALIVLSFIVLLMMAVAFM